jgi:hypothetical protein
MWAGLPPHGAARPTRGADRLQNGGSYRVAPAVAVTICLTQAAVSGVYEQTELVRWEGGRALPTFRVGKGIGLRGPGDARADVIVSKIPEARHVGVRSLQKRAIGRSAPSNFCRQRLGSPRPLIACRRETIVVGFSCGA